MPAAALDSSFLVQTLLVEAVCRGLTAHGHRDRILLDTAKGWLEAIVRLNERVSAIARSVDGEAATTTIISWLARFLSVGSRKAKAPQVA